jgi:hypothetical protein
MTERSYPRIMTRWSNPPISCPDEEWLSQYEAAQKLGISMVRVGWRILGGYLTPAHNSKNEAGVTRMSVELDREWIASASRRAKSIRVFKGLARWI